MHTPLVTHRDTEVCNQVVEIVTCEISIRLIKRALVSEVLAFYEHPCYRVLIGLLFLMFRKQGDCNMGNFVLVYTGGMGMGMSEEQQAAVMADWTAWYGKLGEAIVDGGNPFGESKHISAAGVSDGPVSSPAATGYTVISAESLDAAVAKSKDHPHIKHGGEVTVYETFQVGG
jgi:hypothetical protein